MTVGMLKGTNFNSGLNIYGTVVFSAIKALKLWRFDNMLSEFWAYFHCTCAQTAIWELLGLDLQRIVSATYEIVMISGTYDKLTTTAEVSLENLTSHTRTVGDEASQWKRPKFDPSPHQNPLTDLHQN